MVFAPEAARNPPQPQSKTTAAGDVGIPGDWGFRFVVEPLHGVHYRVVREFELICRLGGGARASAGSLTPRTAFGSQVGGGDWSLPDEGARRSRFFYFVYTTPSTYFNSRARYVRDVDFWGVESIWLPLGAQCLSF